MANSRYNRDYPITSTIDSHTQDKEHESPCPSFDFAEIENDIEEFSDGVQKYIENELNSSTIDPFQTYDQEKNQPSFFDLYQSLVTTPEKPNDAQSVSSELAAASQTHKRKFASLEETSSTGPRPLPFLSSNQLIHSTLAQHPLDPISLPQQTQPENSINQTTAVIYSMTLNEIRNELNEIKKRDKYIWQNKKIFERFDVSYDELKNLIYQLPGNPSMRRFMGKTKLDSSISNHLNLTLNDFLTLEINQTTPTNIKPSTPPLFIIPIETEQPTKPISSESPPSLQVQKKNPRVTDEVLEKSSSDHRQVSQVFCSHPLIYHSIINQSKNHPSSHSSQTKENSINYSTFLMAKLNQNDAPIYDMTLDTIKNKLNEVKNAYKYLNKNPMLDDIFGVNTKELNSILKKFPDRPTICEFIKNNYYIWNIDPNERDLTLSDYLHKLSQQGKKETSSHPSLKFSNLSLVELRSKLDDIHQKYNAFNEEEIKKILRTTRSNLNHHLTKLPHAPSMDIFTHTNYLEKLLETVDKNITYTQYLNEHANPAEQPISYIKYNK